MGIVGGIDDGTLVTGLYLPAISEACCPIGTAVCPTKRRYLYLPVVASIRHLALAGTLDSQVAEGAH